MTCLVSGGADSTCLWHVLARARLRVRALHVDHGLRGAESEEDARFCRAELGAEIVDGRGRPATEDELREIRYSVARDRLRATGHTASDQVETVLYRLVSSGAPGGIKPKREDGVVRPLLTVWREETEAYCRAEGLAFRDGHVESGHEARPHPRARSCRCSASSTRRRAEPACASAEQRAVEARRAARVA